MTGHTRVCVDMVGDLFHPCELLRQVRAFGTGSSSGSSPNDVAAAGKLRLVRREPGISTTEIIRRVQQR